MPPFFSGAVVAVAHEHQAAENAGNDAADEEVTDGDLRGNAVNHEGVARGNHNADAASCCDERSCEILVIATFNHGRDGQGTDGRDCGRTGTRDGSEEHACGNSGQAHAAVQAAQHFVSEVQQSLGKAARTHEHACRNEEGDGHDGEAVDGSEGRLRDVLNGHGVSADDGTESGKAKRDGDGDAHGTEHHEVAEEHGQRGDIVIGNRKFRIGGDEHRVERQPDKENDAQGDERILHAADL